MKEFDLDAALNDKPVNASGQKCYIVREVTNFLDDKSIRRFVVIFANSFTDAEIWDESDLINDIGMWEEPKISIEDLPKPFKPEKNELYFYINNGCVCRNLFWSGFDENLAKNSQCFKTREDAQKWIDFMKGMME